MRVHVVKTVKRQQSVVLPLIIINVVMFFLKDLDFMVYLVLNPPMLMQMPWQIVTHMFLHADFMHIFFNMWVLFMFGTLLERKIGTTRFLILYFGSGILAAIGHSVFVGVPAVGASGAVMGVMGVLMVLMPTLPVMLIFIPMQLWIAGIFIAMIDVLGVIPGVANLAHLVGMGAGLIYGFTLKGKRKRFQKKFRKKDHMDEAEMDEYLRSGRI